MPLARSLLAFRALRVVVRCCAALYLGLATIAGSLSQAQTQPVPPSLEKAPSEALAGPALQEVKPELFYLLDKNGVLKAVPGFQFEDFIRLWQWQQQLQKPEDKPRYTLQDITVTGDAAAERADLIAKFKIVTHVKESVRIPLRLSKDVLRETPTLQGGGELVVHFEEGVGFVAWLKAEPEKEQIITAKFIAPTTALRNGARVELALPRAPTSKLTLRVPLRKVTAQVSEGATLLNAKTINNTSTEITALGIAGDFQLSWRESEGGAADVPVVLEAGGAIFVKIEDRLVTSDVTLSVRSLGGEFDRFRIQLPPGSHEKPVAASGYKIEFDGDKTTPGLSVTLDKKTVGPVEIHFITERLHDFNKPDSWLELGGINVAGAIGQTGYLAVQVTGEQQLVVGDSQGADKTEDLPDNLKKKDVTAGFRYFQTSTGPYTLPVRLAKRRTRLRVEPTYTFQVAADQVTLEGRLKYVIRGAKLAQFELDSNEWELDEVGPKSLLKVDDALAVDEKAWIWPLITPTTGEVELTFKAHLKLDPASKQIEWSLPRPKVDTVGPAAVVIYAADNVELTPRPEALLGLSRQTTLPPGIKLADRLQAPLVYRADQSQAKFAADRQLHEQAIQVSVASDLNWNEAVKVDVEQRLSYQIQYVAADRLSLLIPRTLTVGGGLELVWRDQGKEQTLAVAAPRDTDDPAVALLVVALPQPKLGAGVLRVRYSLPLEKMKPNVTVPFTVPLVTPQGAVIQRHELTSLASPGLAVTTNDANWSPSPAAAHDPARGETFTADQPAAQIEFLISHEGPRGHENLLVERAWYQTWLTTAQRQDRAVFQLRSSGGLVRLALPETVTATDAEMELLLDGIPRPPTAGPEGKLEVEIPQTREPTLHVLELRYRFTNRRNPPGQLSLELPQFVNKVWIRRAYWQVTLPKDEHLFVSPGNWMSENHWGWHGFFWERSPALEQMQLESWVGATPQTPPAAATNRYLFSTLESPDHVEIYTVSRSSLVFVASCITLVVGLLWLYVPVCRHPGAWLVAGVAILAAALILPETVWLVAQAAGLGLVLLVLAIVLRRSLLPARERQSLSRSSISVGTGRHSTEMRYVRPAIPGSNSSTATAALPAAESKP